jgi:phage shock protein A
VNAISVSNQSLFNAAPAAAVAQANTGGDSTAPRDLLGSLKSEDSALEKKMQDLKKQYDTIESEKAALDRKQKLGGVMAVAEIAGLIAGFATGSMLVTIGCGILGAACMVMAVKNAMRGQKVAQISNQYSQQWVPMFREKQSLEKKIHEMEALRDSAQNLASGKESRVDDDSDEFVIIDGVRLDRKMQKL